MYLKDAPVHLYAIYLRDRNALNLTTDESTRALFDFVQSNIGSIRQNLIFKGVKMETESSCPGGLQG